MRIASALFVLVVVVLLTGCDKGDGVDDCNAAHHCHLDAQGAPECDDGYVWQNPDSPTDCTCINSTDCTVGSLGCPCTSGGGCDPSLTCASGNVCRAAACPCNTTLTCEVGCTCDPDCQPTCACDTSSSCTSGCACDPDCAGACTCDTGPYCDQGCACDPSCECGGRGPSDIAESEVVARDMEAIAHRNELIAVRMGPGGTTGEITRTFDSYGRLTHWQYNADGYADDVDESFTYDSQGRLTHWQHNADGYTDDVDESFTYDSQGRLTHWQHNADGYTDDVDETFTYDSQGRLTHWQHTADGSANDADQTFTYDC